MAYSFGGNTALYQRVLATTIDRYEKQSIDNIEATKVVVASLKKKGRISKASGTQIGKMVRFKRQDLRGLPMDTATITFPRSNKRVNINIPPRGYYVTDSMTWQERQINQGAEAILNIFGTLLEELMDDFQFNYCKEFFKDGNASNNPYGIHGFESFGSFSGTLNAGMMGSPNDTYFGISTAVGLRGSWDSSNVFPNGSGQPGYHYWSPFIWHPEDASWGGSSNAWKDTCLLVAKADALYSSRRGHKRNIGLLNTGAYRLMSNKVETREQINTSRGTGNQLLVNLGFGETVHYEGVEYTHDSDVPDRDPLSSTRTLLGYTLTLKDIELRHWTQKLVQTLNIPFSGETLSDRLMVASICNLFCNPQGVSKIVYASSTEEL